MGQVSSFLKCRRLFTNRSGRRKYGAKTPVRIMLGPTPAYLVSDPEHFEKLLKSGRNLSPKPGIAVTMENMFGTPADAARIYKEDNSGISPIPVPGTSIKPNNRVFYHQHAAAHKYLSGQALRAMTERFMDFLAEDLAGDTTIREDWTEGPDLFALFQKQVFCAATRALFGPWLLRLNPSFTEDFWEYVDETPTLLKGLPRFMASGAYAVRDRVLGSIMKWHKYATEHSDYSLNGPETPEWEEFWGSKYLKVRQENGRAVECMDDVAMAAEDLALLVAYVTLPYPAHATHKLSANANAIVTAAWFLIEIYSDPTLLPRVEAEVKSAQRPRLVASEPIRFDIDRLCQSPLLQSIYAETLRLRVALLINRTPVQSDFELAGWRFRKGCMIAMSTFTAGTNEAVWNTGTKEDHHPLQEFWADRFLLASNAEAPQDQNRNAGQEERREFTLSGLNGAWIPYGGGPFMCPGRHFAKQEMIGSFAVFLNCFEVELLGDSNGARQTPRPDKRFFGLGALPPRDRVPYRIRRRRSPSSTVS